MDIITMHNAWQRQPHQYHDPSPSPSSQQAPSPSSSSSRGDLNTNSSLNQWQQQQQRRVLLAQITNRSTSAPPPSVGGMGTTFDLGGGLGSSEHSRDSGQMLFGARDDNAIHRPQQNQPTQVPSYLRNEQYDTSGTSNERRHPSEDELQSYASTSRSDGSEYLMGSSLTYPGPGSRGRNQSTSRTGYSSSALPDTFLSGKRTSFSTQSLQQAGSSGSGLDFDYDSDRQKYPMITRPKSAAPKISIPPPPGMGAPSSSGGGSLLYDSTTDQLSIMQAGMRRPASTGIIGENQHYQASPQSLGLLGPGETSTVPGSTVPSLEPLDVAVRPAPKTLMELIQEDFPKTPSPEFGTERLAADLQLRPRSASPPRSTNFQFVAASPAHSAASSVPQPEHPPQQRQRQHPQYARQQQYLQEAIPSEDGGGLARSIQNLQVSSGVDSAAQVVTIAHQPGTSGVSPQYVSIPVSQLHRQNPPHPSPNVTLLSQTHQPIYTTNPHLPPHIHHMHQQQPPPYEVQAIYYNTPHTNTQETHPAVYVNTAPYFTVQYAAPPHVPTRHPLQGGQEYISVVPLHSSPAQLANGSYTYWHPPQNGAPTVAVHAGNPTVTQGGVPPGASRQQQQHRKTPQGSRNVAEKSQKRRGGGKRGGVPMGEHAVKIHGGVSSPLLEEFRNCKNRNWAVEDLRGHIVEFCQDQNGSRFIQQRLEVADTNEKLIVMAEVLPEIKQLRNDVFGNYVVQKLLEHGTPQMKADLRDTLLDEMLPLSIQMYGCRVVQKALETLPDTDLPSLLQEFHGNVIPCIHDQNGNHVMQKCIEVMSTKAKKAISHGDAQTANDYSHQIQFILNDVLSNVADLSCHPYGCRVMQRILEHCLEEQKIAALDKVRLCHRALLDDQYGNYVIQHVLQFGRHGDRESILKIVVESGLLTLSRQKFASNVVEKLLKYGTPEQRNTLVREMLKVPDDRDGDDGSTVVLLMVRDAYANYVVQTTLDVVSEGEERRMLLEELNSHSAQLRNYTFAKHIVAKLAT